MKKFVGIVLLASFILGSGLALAEEPVILPVNDKNIIEKLSYLGDAYAYICETEITWIDRNGVERVKKAKTYTQVNWSSQDRKNIYQESANLISENWACVPKTEDDKFDYVVIYRD